MADYNDRFLGLREGVVTVFEQLDGSARKERLFYDQLSPQLPISGDFDRSTNQPVRTVINRRAMHPDKIVPISQKEWNAKILNYQQSGFTSAAHDEMVAGRHYTQGEYEASVVWPMVFEDHAWFNSLEELENSLPLKSDKIEKIHLNILLAKNVQWLKALIAPSVKRASRTDDSDLVTKDVALPPDRYRTPLDESKPSLTLKDISLLNALTKDMNGARKMMLMSSIQWSHFYMQNFELFKNNDYVPGSDLTQLDTIRPFQGGITPIAVEDTVSATGEVLFGLDESQIIIANPGCVAKCVWGGKTCDYSVDGHAYNQVQCWSREVLNYVRTSDKGVLIITIPLLVPTLSVLDEDSAECTSISAESSETSVTLTVKTNENRLVPQEWHVVTDATWIKVSPERTHGSGELTLTLTENTSESSRSASVEVHSTTLLGVQKWTIAVTQSGVSSSDDDSSSSDDSSSDEDTSES